MGISRLSALASGLSLLLLSALPARAVTSSSSEEIARLKSLYIPGSEPQPLVPTRRSAVEFACRRAAAPVAPELQKVFAEISGASPDRDTIEGRGYFPAYVFAEGDAATRAPPVSGCPDAKPVAPTVDRLNTDLSPVISDDGASCSSPDGSLNFEAFRRACIPPEVSRLDGELSATCLEPATPVIDTMTGLPGGPPFDGKASDYFHGPLLSKMENILQDQGTAIQKALNGSCHAMTRACLARCSQLGSRCKAGADLPKLLGSLDYLTRYLYLRGSWLEGELAILDKQHAAELQSAQFPGVGSSRVDLQACKLEYSIVSPK